MFSFSRGLSTLPSPGRATPFPEVVETDRPGLRCLDFFALPACSRRGVGHHDRGGGGEQGWRQNARPTSDNVTRALLSVVPVCAVMRLRVPATHICWRRRKWTRTCRSSPVSESRLTTTASSRRPRTCARTSPPSSTCARPRAACVPPAPTASAPTRTPTRKPSYSATTAWPTTARGSAWRRTGAASPRS